jgi:hypothetical protein
MDSTSLHGIVHSDPNGTLIHLPLEEVHVNVFLLDGTTRSDVSISRSAEPRDTYQQYLRE